MQVVNDTFVMFNSLKSMLDSIMRTLKGKGEFRGDWGDSWERSPCKKHLDGPHIHKKSVKISLSH